MQRTLASLYPALVLVAVLGSVAFQELADLRTALLSDQLPSQHPSVAIVAVTDDTLAGYRTYLPVNRDLLARLVDAIDAAGAKVIGLDFLFTSPAADDGELLLIEAIRRARAKVVLAAADERIRLSEAQRDKQQAFFPEVVRPAGYSNLATERDSVVRFMAQPSGDDKPAYPKSFAALLAASAGLPSPHEGGRIAWLRPPRDGSDTFLTISADTLLRPAGDPVAQVLRAGLKDKIVLVGSMLRQIDTHVTPLTTTTYQPMPGATIHAHITAKLVDGRGGGYVEDLDQLLWFGLVILIAAFGFLIGWRYGLTRRRILFGRLATVVILAFVLTLGRDYFWGDIKRAIGLALLAWFIGEISGHHLGRILSRRSDRSAIV